MPTSTTKSQRRRWSPLTCLGKTDLSPSGLIQLESTAGEVETLVCTNCELRYEGSGPLPKPMMDSRSSFSSSASPDLVDDWTAIDVNLSCHITTHRIVLLDENEGIGGSIPYPLIQTATSSGGPSFRSPMSSYKIDLTTLAWGELLIVFRGGQRQSYAQSGKDRDAALTAIRRAMKRKAWEDRERQAQKEALRPSNNVTARKVGVGAIITKNELQLKENAKLAESAFGGNRDKRNNNTGIIMTKKKGSQEDIDAFMREASPLLKVIQKYTSTIERERRAAASNNGGSDTTTTQQQNDTDKLVSMLENMGMTSALSEKQSGSMYHKQLARQIVDFLHHNDKLTKAGGMMTLTDVYCLFNRARGTNMISPDDLLKALDYMKELRLGMSRRTFESSGVIVLQDDAFDDEVMAKKLSDLASASMTQRGSPESTSIGSLTTKNVGGITVIDVSRTLNIPALLANEQLKSAEQMGWLCRDSTIEGIRYFPNLFNDVDDL